MLLPWLAVQAPWRYNGDGRNYECRIYYLTGCLQSYYIEWRSKSNGQTKVISFWAAYMAGIQWNTNYSKCQSPTSVWCVFCTELRLIMSQFFGKRKISACTGAGKPIAYCFRFSSCRRHSTTYRVNAGAYPAGFSRAFGLSGVTAVIGSAVQSYSWSQNSQWSRRFDFWFDSVLPKPYSAAV